MPLQIIRVLVVLGVGAIMGDGVLTPAISVVSSIEGVQVSFPSVTRGQTHLHFGLPAAALTLHCSC